MSNFTFLDREQVFGKKKLSILEKYGIRAAITDFSILLGGAVDNDKFTISGNHLSNRTCDYWTKSTILYGDCVFGVGSDSEEIEDRFTERMNGARIVVPYSDIKQLSSREKYESGIKEVEYGEYPQTVVSRDLSNYLEKLYMDRALTVTGKQYTTDSRSVYDGASFKARNYLEYLFEGKNILDFWVIVIVNMRYYLMENKLKKMIFFG